MSVFQLMTLNIMLRVALGSVIIFTNPCLDYSVVWCWHVMSRCDLDIWPVDFERLW